MSAHSDQTFSNILNVVSVRTNFLNSLGKEDRINASSLIERYSKLSIERLKLVGKTYGSKAMQAKDEVIVEQMAIIRKKIETLNRTPLQIEKNNVKIDLIKSIEAIFANDTDGLLTRDCLLEARNYINQHLNSDF